MCLRTCRRGLGAGSQIIPSSIIDPPFPVENRSQASLRIREPSPFPTGCHFGETQAIRTATDTSLDPEFVLCVLNKRLLRRGDAQATCLALHICADGQATLANAGHMAPYLNGEPVAMEGALPLGMIEAAESSVMHLQLDPGDTLVLMSDGIVEATDAEGHLFGFERVQALLRTAKSVADIASSAQNFGQEDDISVISVTRTPVIEPALA